MSTHPVIVVVGPTASGKSWLALRIAQAFRGEIINADSMQVYEDLAVLTARPNLHHQLVVPHHLYGVLGLSERSSAGSWRQAALDIIRECHEKGTLPILVGGTGLYIRAMIKGLHRIPSVPSEIRDSLNTRLRDEGVGVLYAELAAVDCHTSHRVNPADGQRIVRALEIFQHTGKTLSEWQTEETEDAPDGVRFLMIVTAPPRDTLYERINSRFDQMLGAGAIEEVETLLRAGPEEDFPLLKAVGVPPIRAFIGGEINRERMQELGKRDTRRYAKRQNTWFRNQIIPDLMLQKKLSEKILDQIFPEISEFMLTT